MEEWHLTPEQWALIGTMGKYIKWAGSALGGIAVTGTQLINIYKFIKGKIDEKSNSRIRNKKPGNSGKSFYDRFGRRNAK